jgi:hypothetical protein
LAEIVQICDIRHWTEQTCKQVKDEMGWADIPASVSHASR